LVENKDSLIAQKKAVTKWADPIALNPINSKDENELKANNPIADIGDELRVKVIINTTNLMDGHSDVHIPGLWNKSLKENKSIMHLQEHKTEFDKIISDGKDLKAFTEAFTWKELGQKIEGTTEALVFESLIKRSRNAYMIEQYGNGYVKQHSVGMQYVKIGLALNDEESPTEFAMWEKYIGEIANPEAAIKQGFFWFVTEAKAIEGSAVPLGSNWVTPTLENNLKNSEPLKDTQETEPLKDTQIIEVKRRRFI